MSKKRFNENCERNNDEKGSLPVITAHNRKWRHWWLDQEGQSVISSRNSILILSWKTRTLFYFKVFSFFFPVTQIWSHESRPWRMVDRGTNYNTNALTVNRKSIIFSLFLGLIYFMIIKDIYSGRFRWSSHTHTTNFKLIVIIIIIIIIKAYWLDGLPWLSLSLSLTLSLSLSLSLSHPLSLTLSLSLSLSLSLVHAP